jgi:hypothetical protein
MRADKENSDTEEGIRQPSESDYQAYPEPDQNQHFLANLLPDWEPPVEELKTSLNFIQALESALLDNGDIDEYGLERLCNPPREQLAIENANDLQSLEHFLATIHSSEQTYTALRNIHNAWYPTNPLLSYDQIKQQVAQWSGVVPIVHHMCPQLCAAYTGPYDQIDTCPECNQTRYDQFLLETSQGKVKVSVQAFYTIALGPQIQAMWCNPNTAKKLMHHRTVTNKNLDQLIANGGNIEIRQCSQSQIRRL